MNAAKTPLRADRRAARAARSEAETTAAGRALMAHLLAGLNERGARSVAGYVPVGSEPGTVAGEETALPDGLRAAGIALLLPVFRPDRDLDWAWYTGPDGLVRSERGLLEPPAGAEVGRNAVAGVDLVVVPALAVSRAGDRLGRGAGCYDRSLTRLPAGVPVVALLYDDELLPAIPAEAHDRPVTDVVTPTGGWQRLSQ
jgi:5-formyltetrahydrofolate cyclo-ligase